VRRQFRDRPFLAKKALQRAESLVEGEVHLFGLGWTHIATRQPPAVECPHCQGEGGNRYAESADLLFERNDTGFNGVPVRSQERLDLFRSWYSELLKRPTSRREG